MGKMENGTLGMGLVELILNTIDDGEYMAAKGADPCPSE